MFCILSKHQRPKLPSCPASANLLLVFVSHSVLLLHTPVAIIQGLPRPAVCLIALTRSWVDGRCRFTSVITRAYETLWKHVHSCSGNKWENAAMLKPLKALFSLLDWINSMVLYRIKMQMSDGETVFTSSDGGEDEERRLVVFRINWLYVCNMQLMQQDIHTRQRQHVKLDSASLTDTPSIAKKSDGKPKCMTHKRLVKVYTTAWLKCLVD